LFYASAFAKILEVDKKQLRWCRQGVAKVRVEVLQPKTLGICQYRTNENDNPICTQYL